MARSVPHAAVSDIGAVLLRNVVVLGDRFGWIQTKLLQRQIEPFREDALNVIPIAFDGAFAPALPDHVGVPVSFPGLPEGDPSRRGGSISFGGCWLTRCRTELFGFRMLPSADFEPNSPWR